MNTARLRHIMLRSWALARGGARRYGGKARDYIATAMRLAWRERRATTWTQPLSHTLRLSTPHTSARTTSSHTMNGGWNATKRALLTLRTAAGAALTTFTIAAKSMLRRSCLISWTAITNAPRKPDSGSGGWRMGIGDGPDRKLLVGWLRRPVRARMRGKLT